MSDAMIRDFLDAVKRFDPKYYEDIGLVWFEVPTSEIKYVKYNNGWLEIKLKDTSEFRIDMLDFTYVYPVDVPGEVQKHYESAELKLIRKAVVSIYSDYTTVEIYVR